MQKSRKWLLLASLLFLWMTPVWAGSMDLGGFAVDVGEGALPSKPQPTQEPESTPKATQKPESTPKATQKPESTPKATQKPESTPKATRKPESTPKATRKPESTPKVTRKPESTPKPTWKPESTPKVTRKPMATPKPTQNPQNTPDLMQGPVSVGGQNQGLERNQGILTSESPKKESIASEGGKDEKDAKKGGDGQEPLGASKTSRALNHSQKTVQKADFIPRILVQSPHEIYVLSYRINGKEVFWHWEKDWLIPENPQIKGGSNNVQLVLLENGKTLWKMKEWQFFVKSL